MVFRCADPQGVWISTFSTTFPEQQHKPRPRQADLPAAGRPPRDRPILGAPAQPRGVCPQHCLHFHHVWDAAASCETVCMSRECKSIFNEWRSACFHYYHDTLRFLIICSVVEYLAFGCVRCFGSVLFLRPFLLLAREKLMQ